MGKLTRLIPHYTQPHGAAQVDWSNPLTKGLRDLSLLGGSQRYNAARKTFLSSNGTVDSDPRGPKISTDATAYSVPGGYAVLPITVIVGFVRLGPPTSGNHALWISLDDISGTDGLYLRYEDAGTLHVIKSQVASVASSAYTIKPGGSLFGLTIDAGTYALYGDGALLTSGTHAQTFVSAVPVIGSESSNAAQDHPNGIFYFHAVWDRVLSADEIKRVSANPWQLFPPRKREIYVVAVVAADANSAGVATATGVSGAIAGSDGASAGVGTATGISGVIAGSVASSAGTSTAQADTSGTIVEATASSAGTSTASGISGAIQGSVGSSSGSSTAEGVGADGAAVETTDTHDGWLQPVKRHKQTKEVRRELERLFKKAEVVVEKIAPKPIPKTVQKSVRVVETGLPPIHELQMVLMHMQLIQDQMTGQQLQHLADLQAQMDLARMYNIRARAALLAA